MVEDGALVEGRYARYLQHPLPRGYLAFGPSLPLQGSYIQGWLVPAIVHYQENTSEELQKGSGRQ